MPIDVSLSLHGVSGIFMGNAIMIKTMKEGGILPNRYYKNVALQATAVDHTISPEGWSTEISTLMRPLADMQTGAPVSVIVRADATNHDQGADVYKWAQNWRDTSEPNLRKPIPEAQAGDQALADRAGIPVNILRAVRAVESSGRPTVLRFEPHKWKSFGDGVTYPVTGFTLGYKSDGTPLKYSTTRAETNRAAFETNYAINPTLAVKSTSFGSYQVMGESAIKQYGTAEAFWKHFNEDPTAASDRLLVQWFKDAPTAIAAANVTPIPDFVKLATRYNGGSQADHHYDALIAEAYDKATRL
jgi:hypothetical protein